VLKPSGASKTASAGWGVAASSGVQPRRYRSGPVLAPHSRLPWPSVMTPSGCGWKTGGPPSFGVRRPLAASATADQFAVEGGAASAAPTADWSDRSPRDRARARDDCGRPPNGDNDPMNRFQAALLRHQFRGEPVEQRRMRRQRALRPEVVFGFDDPAAKVLLPDAVDDHACRKRIGGVDDPAREIESRGFFRLSAAAARAGVPGVTLSPCRVKSPLMKIKLSLGAGSSDITKVRNRLRLPPLQPRQCCIAGTKLRVVRGERRVDRAFFHQRLLVPRHVDGGTDVRPQFRPLFGRQRTDPLHDHASGGVEIAVQVGSGFLEFTLRISCGSNSPGNRSRPPGIGLPWPSSTVLLKKAKSW